MPPLPTGKPDAALIPVELADQIGRPILTKQLKATIRQGAVPLELRFGKDAHTGQVYARRMDHENADPSTVYIDNPRLYPWGHPRQGLMRHTWYVAEYDGASWVPVLIATGEPEEVGQLLVGYLLPDPSAEAIETRADMAATLERRKAEARADYDLQRIAKATEVASRAHFDAVNAETTSDRT